MGNTQGRLNSDQCNRAHWIWILRDQVGQESRRLFLKVRFVIEQKMWNNACGTQTHVQLIILNKDEKDNTKTYHRLVF